MYEQINNRKLWEMFLAYQPEKSFEDWKKEVLKANQPVQGIREQEMSSIIKDSQSILKGFKPPEIV